MSEFNSDLFNSDLFNGEGTDDVIVIVPPSSPPPALSVMEAIETSLTAELLLIPGINAATVVPAHEVFKPMRNAKGDEIVVPTLPDAYPGCVVSLDEEDVSQDGENQGPSSAQTKYKAPVYVALYATSDGTVANEARSIAWGLGEEILRRLMLFVPYGYPDNTTVWPLRFEKFYSIPVDANTHGLMIVLIAEYQMGVIA